jgi:quercetin dioxygenase-like cupin family protein
MAEDTDNKIVNLFGALDYQESSVVSRVLLKNAGGTITLFVFDQGEGLSEHKTPYDAFLNLIEGEAAIRIAETTHQLKAGDSIVLPADIPHAVDAVTRFKMLLVMIKAPKAD